MWKRGGRSSALDRAQALLSARRSSRGDVESVQGSAEHAGAVGRSVKTRPSSPNILLSDLSDLSSVTSGPEHGADTLGSAAAAAGKSLGREGHSTNDLRPQSSLGGGGSRFLKKAPPPAPNSSQSPIRKVPEHRNVSSSQLGSQTAALSRLAQIESRIRSRKQVQEQTQHGLEPGENLTSVMGISPPPASQSSKASMQLSAQSSNHQSLKGKRFLKDKTTETVDNNSTAAERSPKSADVGVRSRSRAADAFGPLAGLERKSVRVMNGVSLESDEEDMRKLLGDSFDSADNSLLTPGMPSSIRTANKMMSKSFQKVQPSPPTAAPPSSSSNTAPPRPPAAPSRHSSPFRYTGQAQAHFSPSVLSPSPSPPRVSPSPPGRLSSPQRVGSPQRSNSSMSGCGDVLSLEELFSVGPGSEEPHSEMSALFSEDFKINVMTLDDLAPATLGLTEETTGKEREVKHSVPLSGSPDRHQRRSGLKEKEKKVEQQQEEEDMVDYQSDFESESRTEPDYSVSQVSEHLQGDGEEEEGVSEVRDDASDSDVSRGRRVDDYSSTFSDTNGSSDQSQTLSRSSRSSASHDSRTSRQSARRASRREAAVQTQPDPLAHTWPSGLASLGPEVGLTYMNATPVVAHTLSSERVEALSNFNPAAFTLNEMLKQQLAMVRRFIESSRHLHSSLVQSLGPPDYRYTTLENTKEYIRKHRPPNLTMEEALEEVQREMREASIMSDHLY